MLECLEVVLVGLYIPPPASTKLLHRLSSLIAKYAMDNVLLMGDFDLPPNPELDCLSSVGGSTSDLSAWAETYGLQTCGDGDIPLINPLHATLPPIRPFRA